MIPLWDADRRPVDFPLMTLFIIAVNAIAFFFELTGGNAFVLRWSVVPAEITAGHHLETIVTSMFMHGGWAHIIGNMVFLWAFGPEIEDVMGKGKYLAFYLIGGIVAMAAQVAAMPHSAVPTLGASGAIAASGTLAGGNAAQQRGVEGGDVEAVHRGGQSLGNDRLDRVGGQIDERGELLILRAREIRKQVIGGIPPGRGPPPPSPRGPSRADPW